MTEILLLAQSVTSVTPGSGWEGWTGAGLLGAVLGWLLLKHLPAKDLQLKEYIQGKDTQLQQVIDAKDEQMNALTVKYENKLTLVATAFEKEAVETRAEFKRALDTVMAHCAQEAQRVFEVLRGRAPGARPSRPPPPDPRGPQ